MTLLTLAYRPKTFSDLIGQLSARLLLQAMVAADDMPPSLLFEGTRGSGKTSTARILAAALNCANPAKGDCCAECQSCLDTQAGRSMSVHEIDAASNGGVDEIRAIREMARFSTGGKWRVILLDEAHGMTRQAFNALLRILEEPPPRTIFVLLTTEPDKIMETVRSRSMTIHFRPILANDIVKRLEAISYGEGLQMDNTIINEIAASAGGGLRDAVMLLDQCHRVGVHDLAGLRQITGRSDAAHTIMRAVLDQNHSLALGLLNDYFLAQADASELVTDLIEDLMERFAEHTISPARMIAATKLLWDGRSIARGASRTSRMQTESLIILLYAVFYDPPKTVKPAPPILPTTNQSLPPLPPVNGRRRLSLEEMVGLASEE